MAEIDYKEVFGLDPEEDTGAKEQQDADADSENLEEGAKEQQAADAAGDLGADNGQSEEENSRFAEMRRRAEADARKKADKDIAALGITNDDGEIISSYDELKAYKEGKARECREAEEGELRERLIYSGFSEDEVDDLVNAKSKLAQIEKRLRDVEERERRSQFDARVQEELSLIREIDPSINSVEDLTLMDNFEDFKRNVENGDNYLTAFMKVNRGRNSMSASRAMDSRAHLASTKTRGSGGVDVPDSVIREYRIFNPNATKKEIIEHYRKNHKE